MMADAFSKHDKDLAEISAYATADALPELRMDEDTIREVQAVWRMFCERQGSIEAAEARVCGTLQGAEPSFAALLYPDRADAAGPGGGSGGAVDPETGRITGQGINRQLAAIMRAGAEGAGGPGGGCPFRVGAGAGDEQRKRAPGTGGAPRQRSRPRAKKPGPPPRKAAAEAPPETVSVYDASLEEDATGSVVSSSCATVPRIVSL
mmetsp:Transcript_66522/g.187374  ORF Transcript_66522/g.187374 Transcript_66522/m.187374 type:complete len:206 (+) Transcript_66522:96-713(+)